MIKCFSAMETLSSQFCTIETPIIYSLGHDWATNTFTVSNRDYFIDQRASNQAWSLNKEAFK